MAEKLGSNSGTQVIDLSALVHMNEEIRNYSQSESAYLKTIASYMELLHSKLNKSSVEAGSGGSVNIPFPDEVHANYQPAEKQKVTTATSIGSELGGAAGKAVGGAIGTAIGSTILPGIGTAVGSWLGSAIGGVIDENLSEQETIKEDKKASFKDELNERYSEAQNTKYSSIKNGSAIAMEKETKAAGENKSNTLQAKMDKLSGLQAELDEIAGEEYNKELEKGIDAKIKFIEDNKDDLKQVYAAMGKNAGNDEAAKMLSEVKSMENLFGDRDFQQNLLAGNSYVIDERFVTALANSKTLYNQTDTAKAIQDMNLFAYEGIGAGMVYSYDDEYAYKKKFQDFDRDAAIEHADYIYNNITTAHMTDEEKGELERKARVLYDQAQLGDPLPRDYQFRGTTYYANQVLSTGNFNVPRVEKTPVAFASNSNVALGGGLSSTEQLAVQLPPTAPAYIVNTSGTAERENKDTAKVNNYNANLNIETMQVMDRAMVQTVVDEMLKTLTLTFNVTPQVTTQ